MFNHNIRRFSSSRASCSLFTDYLAKIQPGIPKISPLELKSNFFSDDPIEQKFKIIDVRETYEYNEESIPTATYIGKGILERDIESVVQNVYDPIVLYCAAGPRSVLACDSLIKMGYQNVRYLTGGIKAWKDVGGNVDENFGVYSK